MLLTGLQSEMGAKKNEPIYIYVCFFFHKNSWSLELIFVPNTFSNQFSFHQNLTNGNWTKKSKQNWAAKHMPLSDFKYVARSPSHNTVRFHSDQRKPSDKDHFLASATKENSWEALGRDFAQEVLSLLLAAGHGCWSLYQRVLCS